VYKGRVPSHFSRDSKQLYEVCRQHQVCHSIKCRKKVMVSFINTSLLSDQQASQASASADTSLEDLKKLNPKQSPLDSLDQLHSALDGVFGEKMPGDEVKANMRARSVSK